MNRDPFLSARALTRAIKDGRLTAREALEHCVERQQRHGARLNAIVIDRLDAARREAAAIDRVLATGGEVGPLAGVPITVKESFDVEGLPTTWGLERHCGNVAARTAVAVQRLVDAGAIVWGKSNVPVLLADWQTHNPIYGVTNNPWDTGRTPGGSSGGAAAALAAGLTTLEYGSDIGGSIRGPAHYCGVYGHKPTYGLVPTLGHALPETYLATDMSVVGPLARSAADLELALRLTAGPTGVMARALRCVLPAPRRRDLRSLRVAVLPDHPVAPVDAAISAALQRLADFLAARGAQVTFPVALPFDVAAHDRLYVLLRRAATSMRAHDDAAFARLLEERRQLDPADRRYAAEQVRGNTLHHREWLQLDNERHRLRRVWDDFFRDYDVLLCPAAATTAFPHNRSGQRWERSIVVNGGPQADTTQIFWMGYASVGLLPATVAPIERAADGLPIGVQIVGPQYEDLTTLRVAALLEREYCAFTPPPGYD